MSKICKEYPSEDAPRKCAKGHSLCWSKQRTNPDQNVWVAMCFWCVEILYYWYNGELIKND